MVLISIGRKVQSPSNKVEFRSTWQPLERSFTVLSDATSWCTFKCFICTVLIIIILKSHIEIRILNATE